MAAIMKWGIDDCLTDLFGDDAHEKISWVKETHNETLLFVLSLTETDRLQLFRATAEGQGYIRVQDAQPGDGAIGTFRMGVSIDHELLSPWFAQMGPDHHWYIRMPHCIRVVDYVGELEIYRCHNLL